jgi:hypothetical protein
VHKPWRPDRRGEDAVHGRYFVGNPETFQERAAGSAAAQYDGADHPGVTKRGHLPQRELDQAADRGPNPCGFRVYGHLRGLHPALYQHRGSLIDLAQASAHSADTRGRPKP